MTFPEGPVDLQAMQRAQNPAPAAPNLVIPRPTQSGVILVSRERLEAPSQRVTVMNTSPIFDHVTFAKDGGLLQYGWEAVEGYRRAAYYVDRILRGANPSDLPVELPTKYRLVINLKTAKTLGLSIPETLLVAPVIENEGKF
jgi:hypothetical protein